MSDVSGIPYMGPMGQGNFFAPQFSNNPQLSAGQIQSAYMPEFYNNQNVVNNLYGGGANAGFGQLTNYYSALGANQLSGIGSLNPYGVFGEGGGGGGGGGASPYQTSPSVWDTGASPFQGGGGSSGFGGGIYDFGGGLGSLGASPYQTTPNVFDTGSRGFQYPGAGALDWGGLYQTAQQSGLSPGMLSGLGGLGGAPYTPQPNQSLDWGSLFGGGGARADPYPGMSMPGGLSSPMTAREPAYDYGSLFKGGSAQADPYPGMTMPGGLSSPMTTQQPAYDYGSLFGQGAGGTDAKQSSPFDTGAAPVTGAQDTGPYGGGAGIGGLDTGRAIGAPYTQAAESQRGMLGTPVTEAYNPYFNVTGGEGAGPPTDARTSGALASGGGLTAADLSEQARAKLAELMTKPSEPSPDQVFAGDKPVPTEGQPAAPPTDTVPGEAGRGGMVGRPAADPYAALPGAIPLPLARPAEAPAQDPNAPRPPAAVPTFPAARLAPNGEQPEAFIVHHTSGRGTPEGIVSGWQTERPGVGTQYIMDRNGVIHDTAAEYGYTGTGQAAPQYTGTIPGSQGLRNQNIVGMEIIARDDKDVTPAQIASLKQFAAERYPDTPFYGHGEISTNKEPTEGQTGAQAILEARPPAFNFDWTNAPIPGPPNGPAESPATQTYPGADAPRPPADIPTAAEAVPLPTARPAAANIAQANSLLDTTVGNLVQKNSPSDASRVPSSIASQTLREALGNTITGGLIRSGIEPYLPKLGVTPAEFDKAYTQGRAAPPRFDGGFGGSGGELPSPGAFTPFEGFRQSADFENRTGEQLGRDQLAELQTRGANYEPGPEVAPTPLGNALGLGDLGGAASALQAAAGGAAKAGAPAGNAYWDIPKEGMPRYNAEVYEPAFGGFIMRRPEQQTTGGASHYEDFPRTGDVEDRRNEVLGRDQLAALKAMSSGIYYSDPEPAGAASNPLAAALGLGNLPVSTGPASGMARTRGFAGDGTDSVWGGVPLPTSTATPTAIAAADSSVNPQQGPTMPSWQASIPPAYRSPEVTAAIETQARRFGLPPEAISAVAGVEGSGWNPRYMTGNQAGVFQIAPGDFQTAGGRLGGLTYDEYRNATPAQQVTAYGDYIASSPNAAYLDAASGDPALAAAILQGIQFSPQGQQFSNEFLGGNQDFQIARDPRGRAPFYTGQAAELRTTSINDMRDAFARRIAGFPQTQSLPERR